MKSIFCILAVLIFATRLSAQSNEVVHLALIAESDEASAAADVLTAQLSKNSKVQLLERNEIQKVYREQGMAAANRDYLKLGRVLGADGLLLLEVVRTSTATNLTARLVAVKPGVILTGADFPWPMKELPEWAVIFGARLDSFLPKLSVLVKEAIPISVVNIRSAIATGDAQQTERELKLLAIQRLSQERQLFVLERQRMQLLGEEKELKSDESTFWGGSYLLEGIVDQGGYVKDVVTINARLTPLKGGAPLLFEVSGNRTNLSEAINRLAAKVIELLKVNSSVTEWNVAEEAVQYFAEARWALRWKAYSEAEQAADSAWALGKKDLDCALVRVRSYLSELRAGLKPFGTLNYGYGTGYDADGRQVGPGYGDSEIRAQLKALAAEHPFGLAYSKRNEGVEISVRYVFVDQLPDPQSIDRALKALQLYYDFCRSSSADDLKMVVQGSGGNNWNNSSWYELGIDDLTAASQVLLRFNFSPASQTTVAVKLGELRALARAVAEWISHSPTVHDTYFVGDRIATHDELEQTIHVPSNIYRCKLEWGCLWQEKPEDSITLYRELMGSPVFSYIHTELWSRDVEVPRVIAWNGQDRKRIPAVWGDFMQELNNSTNVLLQLEAKGIQLADTDNPRSMALAFTNLFEAILTNRDALVENNVEILYKEWCTSDFVTERTTGPVTQLKQSLRSLFYSKYRPEMEAMDRDYQQKTIGARNFLPDFERQKKYLKDNQPYNFFEFVQTFRSRKYSQAQAREIQPLIAGYKTNLIARVQSESGTDKGRLRGGVIELVWLEDSVNAVINPPPPKLPVPAQAPRPKQTLTAKPVVVDSVTNSTREKVANIVSVNKFLKVPVERLSEGEIAGGKIIAHHWSEGKLLLDLQYGADYRSTDGSASGSFIAPVIAILDPGSEHWQIIECPQFGGDIPRNRFYHRTALFNGNLYQSDHGEIRKYDFSRQGWRVLEISGGSGCELFTVAGRLYAANEDTIFEIIDDGKATRILASVRRNPAQSELDKLDTLGTPILFEGFNKSMRAWVQNRVYTWSENYWREDVATQSSLQPELFDDGILFRDEPGPNRPSTLFSLPIGTSTTEFCLLEPPSVRNAQYPLVSRPSATGNRPPPIWKLPAELSLGNLSAAWRQTDLYLLADHSEMRAIVNEHTIVKKEAIAKNGYHAELLRFTHDLKNPQTLLLKFNATNAFPPATGVNPGSHHVTPDLPPVWMFFTTNHLFLGVETSEQLHGSGPANFDYQPGVWMIPLSELDPAMAAQKQIQLAKMTQEKAQTIATEEQQGKSREQQRRELLTKYDHNHNGIIDREETEEALNDPAFIESELAAIDANHNGWLDAGELAWFDANQNKVLEPKEQAGIDACEHLMAAKLMKKLDVNGDGLLDGDEFRDLLPSQAAPPGPFSTGLVFPDEDRDGFIDLEELEGFLKRRTQLGLRPRGMQRPTRPVTGNPIDPQSFKSAVESYWQNPGGSASGLSPGQRVLPGRPDAINAPPNSKTP